MTMTAFFKLIPFLVSDYFYLTITSLIFWLGTHKHKRLAIELICLISLSTILCLLLKEYFAIARPAVQRFIVVYDPYGFPSTDVAVSMIFWGMILARNQTVYLRIFVPLLVILVAISRIYLGVNSIFDITGGFVLGVIIILIWNSLIMQKAVDHWITGKPLFLCLISIIFVGISVYADINIKIYPVILVSYGTLLASNILCFTAIPQQFTTRMNLGFVLFSLTVTIVLLKFIPTYDDSIEQLYISIVGKYAAITIWIIVVAPKIYLHFIKRV